MQIFDVPSQFQPHYESNYPPYSSGKNIEEIIFHYLLSMKDTIETNYIYLPVFWTSYYILHDYKDESKELSNWLETLDKSKKYFTVVQFDSGIFVNNYDIQKEIDITVFSAGGGGLNMPDAIKEYEFHGMKRQFFNGRKGDYAIPLICSPKFPAKSIQKDIYCSFMGRFDTYFSRMDMKLALENNDKFKLFDSISYEEYQNIISRSIFTLAPRGYGFTSFRLYEAIFANSIPIYIWDNEISLPFSDEINWNDFCIIVHSSKINDIEQILQQADILTLQTNLQNIQSCFTFLHTVDYMIRKLDQQENRQNPKKISLAIPHYNNTEFIREALEPALNDERIGEIIICDDKSKDIDTLEQILTTLNNPKIKLYKNQTNLGCYHNKLETVSKCSNEWAILLDSDNIISKEFIDRLYEIPEWNTATIYAPQLAETFPHEPSELLNFKAFANTHITPDVYINNALTNLNFICLINDCNYFLPTQEYIKCMSQYTYERSTIDSLDSNVLFTDWLYNNNTVYIVDNLKYKHRIHPNSNHALSHTCDEPTIRRMLVNKLLSRYS